jgi:hypothetical protein
MEPGHRKNRAGAGTFPKLARFGLDKLRERKCGEGGGTARRVQMAEIIVSVLAGVAAVLGRVPTWKLPGRRDILVGSDHCRRVEHVTG